MDGGESRPDPSTAAPAAISGRAWGVRAPLARTSKVPRSPPKRRLSPKLPIGPWRGSGGCSPRWTASISLGPIDRGARRGDCKGVGGGKGRSARTSKAQRSPPKRRLWLRDTHWATAGVRGATAPGGQEIPIGSWRGSRGGSPRWRVSSRARTHRPRRPPRSVEGCEGEGPCSQNIESAAVSTEAQVLAKRYPLGHGEGPGTAAPTGR